MSESNEERLAHVAYLYYVMDMPQSDIAAKLDVSRSSVSRMLTAARQQRIVRFEIAFPMQRDAEYEQALLDRFRRQGVREVVVATPRHPEREDGVRAKQSVGSAGASWLANNLRDRQILGLSWGTTVEAVVDSLRPSRRIAASVIQLAGELSDDAHISGHDLVRNCAEQLGGSYRYVNAPAAALDEASADVLLRTPQVQEALDEAKRADVAVLGIGQFGMGSSDAFLRWADATPAELHEAVVKGAVGQMAGRFYGENGAQLDLSLNRRIISVNLADIRRVATKLIVAEGAVKAQALLAAINGGLVDVLVVDPLLADAVAQLA